MADPFKSARQRLRRAKTHIGNLEAGIKRFVDSDPSTVVTEPYREGGRELVKITLRQTTPVPDELSDIAVEAIDGLRSALDHACFAVATRPDAKNAYFPFGDSPAELEIAIKGRCKDLPPEIVELLRSYRPHQGGDNLIWAFNKARQRHQHRILSAVGFVSQGVTINSITGGLGHFEMPMLWDDEKNEMVMMIMGPETKLHFDGKVSFKIVFHDAGPLDGAPVLGSLKTFADTTEAIINDIERHAAALLA